MLTDDFEKLRYKYKPDFIKVLFIGESMPHGGTFFYNKNSNLYRYTKEAFDEYYESQIFSLEFFKNSGYWIYDICKQPVNHMNHIERACSIRNGMADLKEIMKIQNPEYIIVCKKSSVRKELLRSGILDSYLRNNKMFFLPFPACGRQKEYRDQLITILKI